MRRWQRVLSIAASKHLVCIYKLAHVCCLKQITLSGRSDNLEGKAENRDWILADGIIRFFILAYEGSKKLEGDCINVYSTLITSLVSLETDNKGEAQQGYVSVCLIYYVTWKRAAVITLWSSIEARMAVDLLQWHFLFQRLSRYYGRYYVFSRL